MGNSGYSRYFILGLFLFLQLIPSMVLAEYIKNNQDTFDHTNGPLNLAGFWQFQTGDDLAWASPYFDDSIWQQVVVPQAEGHFGAGQQSEFAWYRKTLKIKSFESANKQVSFAVSIGKVSSAYEIYVGGHLLGGVGRLPPDAEVYYDKISTFVIPESAIDSEGFVTIALRVWHPQSFARIFDGGVYSSPLLIGTHEQLSRIEKYRMLIPAGLTLLYVFIGVMAMLSYGGYRKFRLRLLLVGMALALGIYTFLSSQWKHVLPYSFFALKKLEIVSLLLVIFFSINLFWQFLKLKFFKQAIFLSFLFLALLVVTLLAVDIARLVSVLLVTHVALAPFLCVMIVLFVFNAIQNVKYARFLLPSVLITAVLGLYDIYAYHFTSMPIKLIPLGFLLVLVSFQYLLTSSFLRLHASLESQVRSRTRELVDANHQMKKMVDIDPLTEIYNRRAFTARVREELARSTRRGKCSAVAVADIDNFKVFNDQYGHTLGDDMLCLVANKLKHSLREGDIVARWGGEEFVLLLVDVTAEEALPILERARLNVSLASVPKDDKERSVTITIGVSDSSGCDTYMALFNQADEAMYQGKKAGRNQVIVMQKNDHSDVA